MQKIKRLARLTVVLLIAALLGGCSGITQSNTDKLSADAERVVTDMLGRSVTLPAAVKKVVAIGPGALRLYCYAGTTDMVAGIEQKDISEATGKPYLLANPSLQQLPVIGPGGPNNAPDPEKILDTAPDVIFSTYAADTAAADELQAKTGIPVVALSYGDTSEFDPAVYDSLELIGKITGQSDKAQAAITFMKQCQQDLNDRTKVIADEFKPKVYVGALSMKGTHGIESTQGEYALLDVLHALNVVDETGKTGSVMIDKEKLLDWNPDIIFIDAAGYSFVREDYKNNRGFYDSLDAFAKGQVYSQLPYKNYSTNIDTAIANAYYLGKIIYPDAFTDVDPVKKADEIYQALLGQPLYKQMEKDFGGFHTLSFD
ncbi:MAG TPA: iron ABC transporter substrate-binding protein [Syntrophomonas sp.]|nr:iron ABC transporter substrate-binding protein [Syntrophomonas sp.]